MKNIVWLLAMIVSGVRFVEAQGPPITADKPIMLGSGSYTVNSLIEIRHTEMGDFSYVPIMLDYILTPNTSVAIQFPYIKYDIKNGASGSSLADIKIIGKYQFFRKDGTGKTFRMVAKTLQTLPTGKELDVMELSTGKYAGYYGIVAGYESLKYGISNELGYNWVPDGSLDALTHKIGLGLPLLKPQYPNKQVNLYFEYTNTWLVERDWYQLLYAQGIQYARKNVTFDLAVQVPLVNDMDADRKLKYSLFLGSRYSF
ncbi:hypothetical protein [Maribacter sp. ACAM166]|uniref:hypothetical protein n=1 Tax=Maribacter sp. ACAM166 TaxID=2508996 RepID=UPI0010FED40F|nr:hypothetical protein [Maribacter sp. ACAM166]TLP82773.1 hypothetical protein ES765_01010 [Maribacter sp. ACAM166]